MTAPVPEEREEHPLPTEERPPGEHSGELPGDNTAEPVEEPTQEHNAETSEDQPSQ